MMLVLVLYYKVFVITLNAKSTEILGCIVLWLVGNEIKFCDILSFKDIWFKATKRRTRCSIYIRYPCGNIQGSCILHLYHVCMGVPVICDRNTTCSVIHVPCPLIYCICQGLTTWQRYHLTDMEAQIVNRNSISFKHISCGVFSLQ